MIFKERTCRFCRFTGSHFDVTPPRSSINRCKKILTVSCVWYLRQIFDVDMNKTGFIVFKALLSKIGQSLLIGIENPVYYST